VAALPATPWSGDGWSTEPAATLHTAVSAQAPVTLTLTL
jgi:hypothetical protein